MFSTAAYPRMPGKPRKPSLVIRLWLAMLFGLGLLLDRVREHRA